MPLNVANNNPGNIMNGSWAASQPGYTGANGHFATFDSGQSGFNAMVNLLTNGRSYIGGGNNTISGIINTWSPAGGAGNSAASTNNYVNFVSNATGIPANQPLNASDVPGVAKAMTAFEGGIPVSSVDSAFGLSSPSTSPNTMAGSSESDALTHPDGAGDATAVNSSPGDSMFDQYSGFGAGQGGSLTTGSGVSDLGVYPSNPTNPAAAALDNYGGNQSPLSSPSDSGGSGASSGGSGDNVSINTSAAPVSGDLTQFQVAGVNAPASAGVSNNAAPSGPTASSTSGQPIYETNATQVGSVAGNTIAKATGQLGQAIQGSEGNLAAAGTSWLGTIEANAYDLFIRGGLVALGLVLLAGAFVFFYAERKSSAPTVIPVPV